MPARANRVIDRGQRKMLADFTTPSDVEQVATLVEQAYALIEGLKRGSMERLGLGPESMLARNPRLV
jgi:crotonobetainyl-CoA:carnitine CoA-transferase CaiB-like acyl-CoA transferase